jgi:hyperosmotically inducible protein
VITGRIKASLLTDPALAGSDVSVNTDHGVVNLTGTVRSHEQQAIASAHAQSQDGVMRIESHLAVLNP